MFDQTFKRTYNVEFTFNTDMAEFRQKYTYGKGAEKPILFIFWPEMFMSQYVSDFSSTLRNYNDMFDVYYCNDEDEANKYFNMNVHRAS